MPRKWLLIEGKAQGTAFPQPAQSQLSRCEEQRCVCARRVPSVLLAMCCHLGPLPSVLSHVTPSPSLGTCPTPTRTALSLEQCGSKGSGPIRVPGYAPLPLSPPPRSETGDRSRRGCYPHPRALVPPWPFGLDTILGEILKIDGGDAGLGGGYMKTWQWWQVGVRVGGLGRWGSGPPMMGDWFSLCFHYVHRILATAGKSIGTWQKEGGEGFWNRGCWRCFSHPLHLSPFLTLTHMPFPLPS